MDDEELLAELGVELESPKDSLYTAWEERVLAGFEDVNRFYETQGRLPHNDASRDIFERLYAVRLERLRQLPDAVHLLTVKASADKHGLLRGDASTSETQAPDDDEALLAMLGIDPTGNDENSINQLQHVRSNAVKREVSEVADKTTCQDFSSFKPLFDLTQHELDVGVRIAVRFKEDATIAHGHFFVLGGQLAYVADVGETFKAPNGETDARLRVIYGNGTESNILMRSLKRALYKDVTGRRLTGSTEGPLFADQKETGDIETGTIYVLRSKSDDPFIAKNREIIHKIGVTGGDVETRIAGASKQSTYLLADVEVVATYKLHNVNRTKVEKLFHKLFCNARLNITIKDRFDNPVEPKEWFLVPLQVIDEAVKRLIDGSITNYAYDPTTATLGTD